MSKETKLQSAEAMIYDLLTAQSLWSSTCGDAAPVIVDAIEAHTTHTAQLREKLEAARAIIKEFIDAVDSEEIIIQENYDNDGWENCGERLYTKFKEALK